MKAHGYNSDTFQNHLNMFVQVNPPASGKPQAGTRTHFILKIQIVLSSEK